MKPANLALSFLFAGTLASTAATGFNNGRIYFITSFNGGGNVYNQVTSGTTPGSGTVDGHDLSADGFNPVFSTFGTLSLSDTLVVRGFEYRTYENNGTDVTHANLFYRVFPTGSPSGAFTQITDSLNNDDFWTRTDGTNNILSGLTPGNYTIQMYTETYTNNSDAPGNVFGFTAGGNPSATFTVVPEPSAALLGGLGVLALIRRRRF